jgi:predicted amidohydrolase
VSYTGDEAAWRQAAWEAAQQIHAFECGNGVVKGAVVIDEDNGRVGRVESLHGLQGAFVHFPGSGVGATEYLPMERMSLSGDQDWEPEGGWRG